MTLTLRDLHKALGEIIDECDHMPASEPGAASLRQIPNLPVYLAVRHSQRKRLYIPIGAAWRNLITITVSKRPFRTLTVTTLNDGDQPHILS
jgi:hypothetical protein